MLKVQSPFQQLFDTDGSPLENGSIYVGVANLNPETNPISIYWDDAGTQPAAQPLSVSSGYIVRNGTPARVYVNADDHSMTVRDSKGGLVFYVADATALATLRQDLAASSGSSIVGFMQAGTGAVSRTVQQKLREIAISVKDFGAVGNGTTDDTAAIDAAIVYGKTFHANGQPPYSTGAFSQVDATVVFPPGKYAYAGTMDFTNVYQYCHLHFDGATILHTSNSAINPICINIGDGVSVDAHQMRITGNVTLARGTRDINTIGIKNNGAHTSCFRATLNISGFERGVYHIGSEEIDYDFGWGAVGDVTWAVDVKSLSSWRPNNIQIRNLFCWGGQGVAPADNFLRVRGVSGAAASGGVISLDHVLVQGLNQASGICVDIISSGEVAGLGTLAINHCWFEQAGRTYFKAQNSRVRLENSFVTLYAQTGDSKIFELQDTSSLVSLENTEFYFDDTALIANSAIIQRADGTTTGLIKQIETSRVKVLNAGPTQVVRLTNVVAPTLSFNMALEKCQQVQFSFAAPKYPAAIVDEFSSGLVLNLTTLVSDCLGQTYSELSGYVDVVMSGSDGGSSPGRGWFRGYLRSGLISWFALDTSAATAWALTPGGAGIAYTVTFPASRAEWFRTWATITVTSSQ